MTHLPYIMGAYGVFVVLSVGFSVDAWLRTARARRRLATVDPRATREGT